MKRLLKSTAVLLVSTFLLAGCGITVKGGDAAVEQSYGMIYQQHMTRLFSDVQEYQGSGLSAGPCNIGGDIDACIRVDKKVSSDASSSADALTKAPVTSRYAKANTDLVNALRKLQAALDLRELSLTNKDNAAFTKSKNDMQEANQMLMTAYNEFPEKTRPLPAFNP